MDNYDKIEILSDIEHIRLRRQMYIGDCSNPNHLFYEVLDNALDEAQAGYCKNINIEIKDNGEFSVEDDGRGFPQGFSDEHSQFYPIIALSTLKSGGKFNKDSYSVSIGLNGVGLACVNALSDWLELDTYRDGSHFKVSFVKAIVGPEAVFPIEKNKKGTKIAVKCSSEYFDTLIFDKNKIISRLKNATSFIKNLNIILNGEKIEPFTKEELVKDANVCFYTLENTAKNKESYKIFFGYSESAIDRNINGSVNLLPVNTGTNITILEEAIKETFKTILEKEDIEYLEDKDFLCGFRGFILLNILEPSYSSQTKEKLVGNINKNYKDIYDLVKKDLLKLFKSEEFQKTKEILLLKFKDYRSSLNKLTSSKYIDEVIKLNKSTDKIDRSTLLEESKLLDCNSVDRTDTELLLVEGDSAGGSIVKNRNILKQALLPLRGKILNVVDKDIKRILDNLEVRSLLNAMGTSCFSKEDSSKIRYDRIIIATDSDCDGLNIQALLIGLFCYLTPNAVKDGRIYVADCCLFGQYEKTGEFIPIWKQEEADPKKELFRFKGLGSYNGEDLKKILLDYDTRKVSRLTVESDKDIKDILNIVRSSAFKLDLLKEKGYINI